MPKPKLIIVDDERNILEALGRVLSGLDTDIRMFHDPVAAWDDIQRDPPQVVLSDVRMPGMDGLRLLAQVKAFDPSIEFILITGHGHSRDEDEARRSGAYAFLYKPFRKREITEVLTMAFDRAALVRENRTLKEKLQGLDGPQT